MIDLFRSRGARARRHHQMLISHLDDLLRLMDDTDALTRRDDALSAWNVCEHLEHVAKVDAGILDGVEKLIAEPSPGKGGPKPPARVMLLFGFIPRGRGRSPEPYMARGLDADEVRTLLEQRREDWRRFEPRLGEMVRSRSRFPHPALGRFDAAQWLRFAQVHARHHEKIVNEILAN